MLVNDANAVATPHAAIGTDAHAGHVEGEIAGRLAGSPESGLAGEVGNETAVDEGSEAGKEEDDGPQLSQGGPEVEEAYRIKGSDGRVNYHDTDNGQFTQNPVENPKTDSAINADYGVGVNGPSASHQGSMELGPQYETDVRGADVGVGLQLHGSAHGGAGAEIGRDGVELGGSVGVEGQAEYLRGGYEHDYGDLDLSVRSSAKAELGGGLGMSRDGPEAGGQFVAEAVALQAQADAETREVGVMDDLFTVKGTGSATANIGGKGLAYEAGITQLEDGSGYRIGVGGGATPLIGGRVSAGAEIGVDPDRVQDVKDQIPSAPSMPDTPDLDRDLPGKVVDEVSDAPDSVREGVGNTVDAAGDKVGGWFG